MFIFFHHLRICMGCGDSSIVKIYGKIHLFITRQKTRLENRQPIFRKTRPRRTNSVEQLTDSVEQLTDSVEQLDIRQITKKILKSSIFDEFTLNTHTRPEHHLAITGRKKSVAPIGRGGGVMNGYQYL